MGAAIDIELATVWLAMEDEEKERVDSDRDVHEDCKP